jgi:hypothetical protein
MKDAVQIAVLMPHAPVLVPALAGERRDEVARTIAAMREVARRVVNHHPGCMDSPCKKPPSGNGGRL